MRQSPELLAAHHARWAAVDPLLADSRPLPEPEAADAVLACPGGVALVQNVRADPGSWGHTFFATRESKLIPRVDDPRAFAELLDLWAARDTFRLVPDSIAGVNWPSRDTAMARALVERGFQPQAVFAVRLAGRPLPGTAGRAGTVETAGTGVVILLHHLAVNPLSGPLWSRCGYRPLFTNWTRGTVG